MIMKHNFGSHDYLELKKENAELKESLSKKRMKSKMLWKGQKELKKQLAEALDKISRRNMQIKDLERFKKSIKDVFSSPALTSKEIFLEMEKIINS